jgi:hypothetical protein
VEERDEFTPDPGAVRRITAHLLGEDMRNVTAAVESFANGWTVVTQAEAYASQLSEAKAAKLVEALRDLAPHILVDGTRCYCSIFGEWWEYDDREHDEKCAAARRALAATDTTAPDAEKEE